MTALIITAILILLAIVIVQIGKVTELSAKIRGEEEIELRGNRAQGRWLLVFMVLFLVFCFVSFYYFKNWMLGYGPHGAASLHGVELDQLFKVTLFFTGIVFVLTHIALFYFSWRYHGKRGQKASFIAHNNTLEIVWSAIPAVVMTFLVVKGLVAWNNTMVDVDPDEDYIEIEATGYQFAWHLRYPGPDGALGSRNYKLISGTNPLGQDWSDEKNLDDFHPSEIVLPVNKKVRVRITSRDVLHNFYLPHFRVKMDAVPGLPTYFVFTPTQTTADYRLKLSEYPEYNVPKDPTEPEGERMWESYNYELACAELCGSSHFAMRRIVRIVTEEEYEAWLAQQQSYYMSTIRGSENDPFAGQVLDSEIRANRMELMTNFESMLASTTDDEKLVNLNHISFEAGTAEMTENSRFQVNDIVELLKNYGGVRVEIRGFAEEGSDEGESTVLARARAQSLVDAISEAGVANTRIVRGDALSASNTLELRIISQ